MSGCVAVLNAGSSSIKFALYDARCGAGPAVPRPGRTDRRGASPAASSNARRRTSIERNWRVRTTRSPGGDAGDHPDGLAACAGNGRSIGGRPSGRARRHGIRARRSRIDPEAIASAREAGAAGAAAPAAQPRADPRRSPKRAPQLPQVACFDTAFHRSQPRLAQIFALPRKLTDAGVRRYGFHGLSYEYVASRACARSAPELAEGRVIIAHLGNGASLCALRDGPQRRDHHGLHRGRRPDDGHALRRARSRRAALSDGQSGMDARAHRKADLSPVRPVGRVRHFVGHAHPARARASRGGREAIDLFVYRIVREIGSLAAALGGLDGLVFTGGIGEHDSASRAEIWRRMPLAGRGNRRDAQQPRPGPDQCRPVTCRRLGHSDR